MAGDSPRTLATSQRSLPTFEKLHAELSSNVDVLKVATQWFASFSEAINSEDVDKIVDLFLEDGFWRDMLAVTWEFRTFEGREKIKVFLQDRLGSSKLGSLKLNPSSIELQQPYPDVAWIQGIFAFETGTGKGTGVFRLVPTASGDWKSYVLYTNLEELKGFPEQTGANRNFMPNHGMWPEMRRREVSFDDSDPTVVIIGAGQSGLEAAARLKLLGVSALIVERNARVGDQWRGRYEALCLHDPVWYDHMPYIPFPASWPVWTPAPKLADWLESYAQSMELNVWLSTTVQKIERGADGKDWVIHVVRPDGSERALKPRNLVFAHGFGGGVPNMPQYPGQDNFNGTILHSTAFKSAKDNIGKKVVVIGACTSGHDICHDHYHHGVDVTLYQRSSTYIMSNKEGMPRLMRGFYWEGCPPTEQADLLFHSFPNHVLRQMHTRLTEEIAAADRELLEDLQKSGFRVNFGDDGCGFLMKALERGGGYYLDVGASQLIADGKIKLKNDSQISHFDKDGIVFENGSKLPADVVIFATGFGDPRSVPRQLMGDDIADQINQVWGLDDEGEINTAWRFSGVEGLHFMMGNLAMCRFFSKHLALIIKAKEENIPMSVYSKSK